MTALDEYLRKSFSPPHWSFERGLGSARYLWLTVYSEEMTGVCLAKHQVLIDMCLRLAESSNRSEAHKLLTIVRKEVEKLEFHNNK